MADTAENTEVVEESTEETTTEAPEAPEESTEEPAGESTEDSTDDTESEPESDDEDGESLSYEDAIKALKAKRKSEASYRTRLKSLEDKFKDAKTPDEVQAVIDELKSENAKESQALVRENVQLKYNLPDDLASILSGDTREELEKHATILAKYVPAQEDDPEVEGGLRPDKDVESDDDVFAAVTRARTRRY